MVTTTRCIALFLVLVILSVGCVYFFLLASTSDASAQQQPNIVVIIADDLGWNDVSFHGSDQIPTPNLDALAYNGVILQRHYVQPTCTPSRTAFLTGRYPIRSGMQGYPLKAAEPRGIPLKYQLLPQFLQQLGYATHLIGKWHVGYYTDHHTPVGRGFDSFFGYYNGYIQFYNHTIREDNITGYDLHFDVPGNLSPAYDRGYMTDLITQKAEDIIVTHDRENPLYLQIAHLAPHSTDAIDPMEVRDAAQVNDTFGYIEDVNRRKFADMVTALDESVGKVVDALRKAEMLENSIILFMSDNGAQSEGFLENFGSNYPLRGLKFTLFEGGVRGAACIYSPLIKKSSRTSHQLLHITDWLPTFYSAAGGDPSDLPEVDGVDQWSSLISGRKSNRKALLLNIDEVAGSSAAISGRYKLIKGASNEYEGYYGNFTQTRSSRVPDFMESLAGSAIASISRHNLWPKKVSRLRESARVRCTVSSQFPKCYDQCLFDVFNDPCETEDISSSHPKVVAELNAFIEQYRKQVMPQTNAPPDPAGFPEHFNGTWMPWLEHEILPSIVSA